MGPKEAGEFVKTHSNLINQLEEVKTLLGSERNPLIYKGDDEIQERTQSYGVHKKPADYLESFSEFIKKQINQSAALSVVVNKPKDLTRKELKEVKMLLDESGFSEVKLETAWRNQTSHKIAASIIGHIRRAALGEALIPFEQRVQNAMSSIFALQSWTPIQRKWLDRLAKQLVHEVVLDTQFINDLTAFQGGVRQLDKVLDNQLDNVLETLKGHLWATV